MSIRAFIAVDIPLSAQLKRLLSDLRELGRPVKVVSPESLHVTLKFLGDIDEAFVDKATAILDEAVAGKPAVKAKLHGLGAFPHAGRPSVVWVGMKNADVLVEVANIMEERFASHGFPKERRPSQPHLTVVRVKAKPPAELRTVIEAGKDDDFGTVSISSIQFYQSELLPAGPQYTVLHTADLSGESR